MDEIVINITENRPDNVVINVSEAIQGDKGDPGKTPVKGVDYFDGAPGPRGLTIATTQPTNPSAGDLWIDTSNN